MSANQDYELFIPPGQLGEKTPAEWSSSEATAYAEWVHSCRHGRVKGLIRYFGMDESASPSALLGPIGEGAAAALNREPFSKQGRLTNLGYALAADMGLLVAAALQQGFPRLTWDIVQKPKSDVSFNQPVLVGFGSVPLDPIQVSTTQAFGIVRGSRDGTAWQRVFEYWSTLAQKSGR